MRKNIPSDFTDDEINALVDEGKLPEPFHLRPHQERVAEYLLSTTAMRTRFGCTWDRCVVPCESQEEHDGKQRR